MTSSDVTVSKPSPVDVLEREQSHRPEDSAAQPSKSAQTDLWNAIKTIVAFQNQAPPLSPVDRQENVSVSFPQERLWLLDQLNPNSAAYNIPFAFRLTGELNFEALEHSLNAILERHAALRTTFATQDGKSVQVIQPSQWQPLHVIDLRQLEPPERETETTQLIQAEAQQPFDLSQGPLFRFCVVRLDDTESLLLLTVHHIVFDGWSEGILLQELGQLYQAFCKDEASPLKPLPIQYGDFAVWQRQWLEGEFLTALRTYWQQQLQGLPTDLQFPLDRARPAVPTGKSQCQKQVLSGELSQALKHLSRQHGATPFATLLAAFKVLLQRYTEQTDLFVCSPVANRNRKELKDLIGYFVNLLVLRSDLSGDRSFVSLLDQVRQTVMGAYAYQDLPVQDLANCLATQPSLSQVMFVLQNTPQQMLELHGLAVEAIATDSGTADFDLSLSMQEESGCLTGIWKYNTDLFDESTIQRMREHFEAILTQVVADPTQALSSLLPLDEAEQQQLRQKRGNSQPGVKKIVNRDREIVSPRDVLELQMTNLWEKALGIQGISIEDSFFDLGGESLAAMRLFADIEKTFGMSLSVNTLIAAPTVEQLTNRIRQAQGSETSNRTLVPLQVKGSKPPLFLVPPAAYTVLHFTKLLRYMQPDQPIYGLEHEGLDGKGIPYIRVEDMAAHYIQEIQTVQPEGPYFIAGRCFGGTVAFEIAQQLKAQGQEVGLLAILDTQTPPNFKKSKEKSEAPSASAQQTQKPKRQYWQRLTNRFQGEIKRLLRKILEQAAAGKPLYVYLQKLIFPRLPQDIIIDLTFGAHKKARNDYTPKVYPGKITLLRNAECPLKYQAKWIELAGEGFDCHIVPGNHKTMFREPNIQVVAAQLTACLEAAQLKR